MENNSVIYNSSIATGLLTTALLFNLPNMYLSSCKEKETGIESTKPSNQNSSMFLAEQEVLIDAPSIINSTIDSRAGEFLLKRSILIIETIKRNPLKWLSEDVEQPSHRVIEQSKMLIVRLAHKDIFPSRISPTVEEGMYFDFTNKGLKLYFEIYNTGEMAYAIEGTKKGIVIEHNAIQSIDDIIERLTLFFF
jgi:hypothetical protein